MGVQSAYSMLSGPRSNGSARKLYILGVRSLVNCPIQGPTGPIWG